MAGSLSSSTPYRPAPGRRLRHAGVAAALGLAAVLFALFPTTHPPAFAESFIYLMFFWIALATSWTILSGFSGYVSFGHGTFYGIGIYTVATLAPVVPLSLALAAAGLAAGAAALGIGAVTFRTRHLRGELFALLTLASSFVLATIIVNTPIDGGPGVSIDATLPGLYDSPFSSIYLMGVVIGIGSMATAYVVQHSKLGRGLLAISDDEDVAEVQGIPTYRYKLVAFALSAALAGIAGGIHGLFVSYVTVSETFSLTIPLYVLLMSVLGGARHWAGPAIGAVLVAAPTYLFVSGESALLVKAAIGGGLVVATLVLPGGVLGFLDRRPARRPAAPAAAEPIFAASASVPPPRAAAVPRGAPLDRRTLLRCENVEMAFSGLRALDGVDVDVRDGEILGLVGPNGSGKSTLINVISGFYRPQGGRVILEERDIARVGGHRVARAGVARTYQIPRPFARQTVLDNVALAATFGAADRAVAAAREDARGWLAFVGLSSRADDLPSALNLHQRKFLELARALAARPRLIMLDEVLAGLTPREITSAITLVERIRDAGTTIVFVEHNIRAVLALSDRLVVLNQGKKIGDGPPRRVLDEPQVIAAYLGTAHAAG